MKISILIIVAIFFGVLFWSIASEDLSQDITFYYKKLLGQTTTIEINNSKFEVEIARSSSEKRKGLSKRDDLKEKRGMIFLNNKEDLYSFWMKDVKFPLDIIWIKDDKIIGLEKNVPIETDKDYKKYIPPQPVDKILELKGGVSQKYNIKVGDKVNFSKNLWGLDVLP
ncbi:MAG: DUF192 domain-containing protein [Patescibacteria group bacterium]|nr:DUF192 domain-containing protein [Patescibacteria group bacterium]